MSSRSKNPRPHDEEPTYLLNLDGEFGDPPTHRHRPPPESDKVAWSPDRLVEVTITDLAISAAWHWDDLGIEEGERSLLDDEENRYAGAQLLFRAITNMLRLSDFYPRFEQLWSRNFVNSWTYGLEFLEPPPEAVVVQTLRGVLARLEAAVPRLRRELRRM